MSEPESACEALQAAVIALIRGDVVLKAAMGERFYDEVPADSEKPGTPYGYVGGVNFSRYAELGCGAAFNVRMRLFVVGTEFGRLKVWRLIEHMTVLLDGAEPLLAGPFRRLQRITVVSAGDVIEPFDPKQAFLDLATVVASGN